MESQKVEILWFEFLFDKTGSLLNTHLSAQNTNPTALHLIQQFLEKSGSTIFPNGQEITETNNKEKRKQRLLLLAFHVVAHFEWNLNILETGLPLHMQFILLKELVKMYCKETQDEKATPDLSNIEKTSILPLLLYHRWVVRTIVQQSSLKLSEKKTDELAPDLKVDNTVNYLLNKLQEEETISVDVLQQAVLWHEDLNLLVLPSLKWTGENTGCIESNEVKSESDETNGNTEAQEVDIKKEPCSEEESMETSDSAPLIKVISSQEIIGQICYDLGTLYFYKENIKKAKSLFEKCSGVQCPGSSFYTVNKRRLSGYYTACCSLLHCPVRDDLISHHSLMSQMEQTKYDNYENLVPLLIKDNTQQEVPYTYRKSLEADVVQLMQQGKSNTKVHNMLAWEVCCCNIIGSFLAGRCVDPESWRKLEMSTKDQFGCFIKLCTESVAHLVQDEKNEILMKLQNVIGSLLMGKYSEERLDVLVKSDAGNVINITKLQKIIEKRKQNIKNEVLKFSSITHQTHQAARSDTQVQISQLEHELQTTSSPSQIPNILMQLHGFDPDPHKKHAKSHENSVYGTYIEDLKDDMLQDLMHVLFSKANQCAQRKGYIEAKSFLDFGFQTIQERRKRYGSTSTFDKLSNFISQEILVANILMAEENREKISDDLLKRIKSNLSYTMSDYSPRPHVTEIMLAYLLNVKEWNVLTELDVRGGAPTPDYREIARNIAGVCIHLTKPPQWRKMAKNMWDSVLRIFTSTVQHKRMLPDGTIIDLNKDAGNLPFFVKFVSRLKEETCLSLIISCLERIRSLEAPNDEDDKEQKGFSMYSHLWPTSIPSAGNINFNHIGTALLEAIDHSVTANPFNPTFLKTQGDTFYENENYLNAVRCYLQAGAASSDFFARSVPKSVWDNAAYHKMISSISGLSCYTQAAILCQFLEPLDYSLAYGFIDQTASDDASELYYNCIWDVTLLEYVIYLHNKRGEHDKKQIAIHALGQPEINCCNPPDILHNAKRVRNTYFLQILAKHYL